MDFGKFEASFVKTNRILLSALTVSIVLSLVTLGLLAYQKHSFIFNSGATFKEKELNEYVCKEGLKSIFTDEVSNTLVTKGIIDLLSKTPFELDVKDYLAVKEIEKNKCKVIIKLESKARSFIVTNVKSESYPFYFKINQIDEIEHKESL